MIKRMKRAEEFRRELEEAFKPDSDEEDEELVDVESQEPEADDTRMQEVQQQKVKREDDKQWSMKVDEPDSDDKLPGRPKSEPEGSGSKDDKKPLVVEIPIPKRQMARSNRGRTRRTGLRG